MTQNKKNDPIPRSKWIRMGVALFFYAIAILWINNWWLVIGFPIIYDLYISKKVKWAFWKKTYKPGEERNTLLEWLDAGIFALVVATLVRTFFIEAYVIPTSSMEKSLLVGDFLFVSKIAYGPKMPNTPLAIPLVHNRFGLFGNDGESYSTWIQWPYKRIWGFGKVERNDVVVFNFPHGDKVIVEQAAADYHTFERVYGEQELQELIKLNKFTVVTRPVDKKDNYVKRCVAIPGDTLQIINGQVYVNHAPQVDIPGKQSTYSVHTRKMITQSIFQQLKISKEAQANSGPHDGGYADLALTHSDMEYLKALPSIDSITENIKPLGKNNADEHFPFDPLYSWTADNMGPFWIPQKDVTVPINKSNISLYKDIIALYEGNQLAIKDNDIYINDQLVTTYTFKMDYYFMMGDNRHNSADSRFWGFVPEDHIVGKASFIWFSSDPDYGFPKNIRWSRLFKGIN